VDRRQRDRAWRRFLTRDAHFAQIDGLRCGQRLEDFLP
jgi:hypothetical protein